MVGQGIILDSELPVTVWSRSKAYQQGWVIERSYCLRYAKDQVARVANTSARQYLIWPKGSNPNQCPTCGRRPDDRWEYGREACADACHAEFYGA